MLWLGKLGKKQVQLCTDLERQDKPNLEVTRDGEGGRRAGALRGRGHGSLGLRGWRGWRGGLARWLFFHFHLSMSTNITIMHEKKKTRNP